MDNSLRMTVNSNEHHRKQQKKALMLHFSGPEVKKFLDMLEDPKTEME